MNFFRSSAIRGLVAMLLAFSFTSAQAGEPGFYIGASAGQATLEVPLEPSLTFDENDTAFKVLAGYNFDFGNFDLGLEGAYVHLGEPVIGDSTAAVAFETTGFSGFGVAALELGPVDLFAKAGVLAWDVTARITGSQVPPDFQFSDSDNGSDFAYGVGARWNIGRLGIRAEYEGFDVSDTESLYMWSVGLTYSF